MLQIPSPQERQSPGHVFTDSPALHAPSPQNAITLQSAGQLAPVSPLEQTPSPQAGLQSAGHDAAVSPELQTPLPQAGLPQSIGHEAFVSPPWHLPSPQIAWFRQSTGQLFAVSPESHLPLPQWTGQSAEQDAGDSSAEHT
jgi:hypothetical protein